MADSKRKLCLANLKAALDLVSVANGYKTDMTTVGKKAIDWDSVYADFDLPVVCIVPGRVRYENRSNDIMTATQTVSLEFCYAAPTQDAAWDTGDDIIDDLIAAVMVDPTRAGNALHTTVVDAQTDAGNPDLQDSRGGTAAGIMTLEIMLSRAWRIS